MGLSISGELVSQTKMSKSDAILLMEELLGVLRAEATDEVKATRSAYARFSFLERV
jgi:hypothetical protein